nr:hypothetical protein Iba_chr03cCG7670 [Ipomoea batatas]
MYRLPVGFRSTTWTTISGRSDPDSGEGFARMVDMASWLTEISISAENSVGPDSNDSNGDNTTGLEHEPRKLPTIAMERSHLQQQKVILNITIYILMKLKSLIDVSAPSNPPFANCLDDATGERSCMRLSEASPFSSEFQRNCSLEKLVLSKWILNNDSLEATLHSVSFPDSGLVNTEDGILYDSFVGRSITWVDGDSLVTLLEVELDELAASLETASGVDLLFSGKGRFNGVSGEEMDCSVVDDFSPLEMPF